MSAITLEEIRKRSTAAFGQSYRVEVMIAIAESKDRRVSLSDLSKDLTVPTSSIQKPLKSLLEIGLLSESSDASTKKKYYLRNESAGWEFAFELSGLKRGTGLRTLRRLANPGPT